MDVDVQDLEVVNNAGNVKRVRPQDIRGKRNSQSRRAFVVDTQQNQLEVHVFDSSPTVIVVVVVVWFAFPTFVQCVVRCFRCFPVSPSTDSDLRDRVFPNVMIFIYFHSPIYRW